jgi:hypothetical protein
MTKHLQDFPISAGDAPGCRPEAVRSPPLCKDCTHCRPTSWLPFANRYENARCAATPRESGDELVDGRQEFAYCAVVRGSRVEGRCGKDAKFFEPITVTMAAE